MLNSPVKCDSGIFLFRGYDRRPSTSKINSNRFPQRGRFCANFGVMPMGSIIEEILCTSLVLSKTLDLVEIAWRVYNELATRRINQKRPIRVLHNCASTNQHTVSLVHHHIGLTICLPRSTTAAKSFFRVLDPLITGSPSSFSSRRGLVKMDTTQNNDTIISNKPTLATMGWSRLI